LGVKQVKTSLLSSGCSQFRLLNFIAAGLILGFLPLANAQVAGGGTMSTMSAPAAPQSLTLSPSTTPAARSGNPSNGNDARTNAQSRRSAEDERRQQAAGQQGDLTEFQQMVIGTTGRQVPIFGASLFQAPPSTFAPVDDVNVGPGYIIGPGDELRLQLSGQVNEQLSVTVDRTGAISIPQIGSVHVAGLPFSQLSAYLRDQIGKYYRNFDLSVNLGSLRTIQVFVTGQARIPGSYTISSLSTLLNALFASGGSTPQGSLRDIQVKRGGQTVTHFDLYDLLLHGDKTRDVSLATGDVIFIPTVGPQIAIVGSVSSPAIYELKSETTIAQVLALAGGETNVAANSLVRLERIYQHAMRSVEEISLATNSNEPIRDGDILSIASIVDRFRDAVTLRGNVANPGRYVWHAGMRVSDLLPNKEALITRNYWRKRNLLGQLTVDYVPDAASRPASATNPYNSEGSLNAHGSSNTNGTRDTAQRSSSTPDSGGSSVGNALTPENSIFSAQTDVILSAPDIDWSYAVIERQSSTDLTTSLLSFNLGKVILDGDPTQNLELLPGDVVTIFSKADLRVPGNQQTRFVRLEGEFIASGVYSVLPGETLRGLLRRAGGFTSDAYLYGSEFTRESTRRVEQQRLREYADQLEAQTSAVTSANQARAISATDQTAATASAADAHAAVARLRQITPIGRIVLDLKPGSVGVDSIPDLALEDGDRFIVPRVPSNVNVEGQVYSANAFVYTDGRRVIDYLRQAGGPDRQADRKRSFVLRADGSVVSQQYADVNRALIYPGDTIVVPPVIDKRAILQRIVDIATIVGQVGLSVATIAILSR
jgi:polysaccharide export outer membrane protein